ncbi:hypothetical protein [Pseudomonas plecoglossicida]|uniref:hypothetical protein n=1 Tax=Pseudomonas plecoglossicida TaxID=70775 RepID=UPI003D223AFD
MSSENLTRNQRRQLKKATYTARTKGCPICRKRFGLGEIEVRTVIEGHIAFVHDGCLPAGTPVNGYALQQAAKDPYVPGDNVWFLNHRSKYRVRAPVDRHELVMAHRMQLLLDLKEFGEERAAAVCAAGLLDAYDEAPDNVRVVVVEVAPGRHGRRVVPAAIADQCLGELLASAPTGADEDAFAHAHGTFVEAQQLDIDLRQKLRSGAPGESLLARAAAIGRSRNATKH